CRRRTEVPVEVLRARLPAWERVLDLGRTCAARTAARGAAPRSTRGGRSGMSDNRQGADSLDGASCAASSRRIGSHPHLDRSLDAHLASRFTRKSTRKAEISHLPLSQEKEPRVEEV